MPIVILAPAARSDLDAIWNYIAQESQLSADRLLKALSEKARLVATQPKMGQRRHDLANGHYRSYLVGNYVVYYQPIADGIRIVRVLHGSRNHRKLF